MADSLDLTRRTYFHQGVVRLWLHLATCWLECGFFGKLGADPKQLLAVFTHLHVRWRLSPKFFSSLRFLPLKGLSLVGYFL
jgi:hypothetical protein